VIDKPSIASTVDWKLTDMIQDLHREKFVIADSIDDTAYGPTTVALTNTFYWFTHIDELTVWLKKFTPAAKCHGHTIDFKTSHDLTLFALTWK